MIDVSQGLLAGAAVFSATLAAQPVQLISRPTPGGIELTVIGASPTPLSASYSLTVTGGSGNRSTQSGRVRLLPGQRVTLVSLALSGKNGITWSAMLHVEANGYAPYTVTSSKP